MIRILYDFLFVIQSKPVHAWFARCLLIVEAVDGANHCVGWYHVGACVGDGVGCHDMGNVLELMEDVESLKHHKQFFVQERSHQPGIAHPIGRVHLAASVVQSAVEGDVGRQI